MLDVCSGVPGGLATTPVRRSHIDEYYKPTSTSEGIGRGHSTRPCSRYAHGNSQPNGRDHFRDPANDPGILAADEQPPREDAPPGRHSVTDDLRRSRQQPVRAEEHPGRSLPSARPVRGPGGTDAGRAAERLPHRLPHRMATADEAGAARRPSGRRHVGAGRRRLRLLRRALRPLGGGLPRRAAPVRRRAAAVAPAAAAPHPGAGIRSGPRDREPREPGGMAAAGNRHPGRRPGAGRPHPPGQRCEPRRRRSHRPHRAEAASSRARARPPGAGPGPGQRVRGLPGRHRDHGPAGRRRRLAALGPAGADPGRERRHRDPAAHLVRGPPRHAVAAVRPPARRPGGPAAARRAVGPHATAAHAGHRHAPGVAGNPGNGRRDRRAAQCPSADRAVPDQAVRAHLRRPARRTRGPVRP